MGWLMAVMALLATAGKAYQQKQVEKKQGAETALAMTDQANDERKARAAVQQELAAYSPQKAAVNQQAEQASYLQQVQQAIGAKRPYQADQSLPASVQRANTLDKQNAGDYDQLAKLFGTIGAAGSQRQHENAASSLAGSTLNRINDAAQRDLAARELGIRSVRANPWLTLFLNAAQAYGTAGAMGALGKSALGNAANLGTKSFGAYGMGAMY